MPNVAQLLLQSGQPVVDWGRYVIQFFDANPGVFVALVTAALGLLGVIPFIVRVEFNRRDRESKLKQDRANAEIDQLREDIEQDRDIRKLLLTLTESINNQNNINREDRAEARREYMKALAEQNDKFSRSIGQIAGNQASSVTAIQKTSDALTEVKNQLVQMQVDALNRDKNHQDMRIAVENSTRANEDGFKSVGESIDKLAKTVTELKTKWNETRAFDQELKDTLQTVKVIIDKMPQT